MTWPAIPVRRFLDVVESDPACQPTNHSGSVLSITEPQRGRTPQTKVARDFQVCVPRKLSGLGRGVFPNPLAGTTAACPADWEVGGYSRFWETLRYEVPAAHCLEKNLRGLVTILTDSTATRRANLPVGKAGTVSGGIQTAV